MPQPWLLAWRPLPWEAKRKERLSQVDVVLGGDDWLLTNLTGHPSLVLTCGSDEAQGVQLPGVVKLTAAAYREQQLLHVAHLLQIAIPPTPLRPTLDDNLR